MEFGFCLQHVRRDAAHRAGLSATADPCFVDAANTSIMYAIRNASRYEIRQVADVRRHQMSNPIPTARQFSLQHD